MVRDCIPLQLVSPCSHAPDDTAVTPVQEMANGTQQDKSRGGGSGGGRGPELSRISEDDRHRSSDHQTNTQV